MSLIGKRGRCSSYHPWSIKESEIPRGRIPEDELLRLLNNIREGKDAEEAEHKIIMGHVRWALYISGSYISRYGCKSLADDLDSEALLGLSHGVSRLKKMKHDNVTGYLAHHVNHRLLECIHRSPTVRVPRNQKPVVIVPILKYDGGKREAINTKEFVADLVVSEEERKFVMWRIEGYSFQEIADFMGVSLPQAYLIRKRIRERYDERKRNCSR